MSEANRPAEGIPSQDNPEQRKAPPVKAKRRTRPVGQEQKAERIGAMQTATAQGAEQKAHIGNPEQQTAVPTPERKPIPEVTEPPAPKNWGQVFERRAWMWIMLMVNIVFILLLMTIGIIALRVDYALPENSDILFIVSKDPEFLVDDDKGAWTKGREIDIFKAEYSNGEGSTTVASSDGTKVIAPGTETTYNFTMYNSGNMAVVYNTDLEFKLKIGDEVVSSENFPLQVRLKNATQDYIIGGEDEWVKVYDATLEQYSSQLGASSFEDFELQLKWEFDGGNDELDTLYGDLAAERGVTLTLTINTYAVEHDDPRAQGGLSIGDDNRHHEYGGTIRWLWLLLLFINTAVIIFYISWLMNKRLHKQK